MSTHLHRRIGGTYYFRRAVPLGIRPILDGQHEWFCSLRTKTRSEAKRLLPFYTVQTDQIIVWAGVADNPKPCPPFPPHQISLDGPRDHRDAQRAPKKHYQQLLALFDAYADEQRIKPTTSAEWRAILAKLIAFLGHDDAGRLSTTDIDRWRDHLIAERIGGKPAREPGTVKGKYLTAVRATLNWAVEKRLLAKNVAESVVVRVPKKTILRQRDLTETEVSTILSGTLIPHKNVRPELALARRWIPWICAYTGARVNEISQLRKEDIFVQDGISVIRITPDAGTVKSASARLVPVHSHLIEQGLLTVIDRSPSGPLFFDPTRTRKPGPSNRYIKKVGEHLRDWIRDELGIIDPHVQPNHGWRHRFKTVMIELNVPERVADAIQGHAPRSVGQTYGSVSLGTLKRAIDGIPSIQLGV